MPSRFSLPRPRPNRPPIAGKGPSSPDDAALFVQEVDALLDFVPNVPKPLQAETREVFLRARNYYADMAAQAAGP